MKILYIFPHPDDESFGPAPAISAQLRQGHEVYLLTLTKGEATKQRFRLGVDKKEMGLIRYKEMQCVEKTLGLNGMTVLDLPDNELKKLNEIYRTLSMVNQLIVREKSLNNLLEEATQITFDYGKYQNVWIGKFGQNNEKLNMEGL